MGTYSMIKRITLRMQTNDTTNTRTLGRWVSRALGIARSLDQSQNIVNLEKLQTVVSTVAEQFENAEGDQSDNIQSQLNPRIHRKKKEILSAGDKSLDQFQSPEESHSHDMQAAMVTDDTEFRSMLSELNEVDSDLLSEISELHPIGSGKQQQSSKMLPGEGLGENGNTCGTKANAKTGNGSLADECPEYEHDDHFMTLSPSQMSNEEREDEQLYERLIQYKQKYQGPPVMIEISDMGTGLGTKARHFIPLNHTFCALADTYMQYDNDSFLPDFWSKGTDPLQNTVTPSGVCWEWQDPSKKVLDVIGQKSHLGLETVHRGVDYVVVLVKKGEEEQGMPIDVPRTCREKAFAHLERYFRNHEAFQNHKVSQVRKLQGDDASDILFDVRYFPQKTNSLFVELQVEDQEQPLFVEVEVGPELRTSSRRKGKERARPMPYSKESKSRRTRMSTPGPSTS
ncbi:hypothetical protein M408DRAFT_196768 [Serendipita vermifera MAFF 305830]|uniref:Uncharacterized protein n=1 Tax=Serendipita vermifera MAFF 305830 TaxID=933852 RepID=A0A0C3B1T8_SERVB|nr:hypothetical protein M408DRAFT_196768 [Serendipita vermifera MAFF 305830]